MADEEEAGALLEMYNVEYIYIGSLEKQRYGMEGLLKFSSRPDKYSPVYQNQDVTIYQILSP